MKDLDNKTAAELIDLLKKQEVKIKELEKKKGVKSD